MSDLWYPGRHPFCSKEIVGLLDQAIETLTLLIVEEDGTYLLPLEKICVDGITLTEDELDDCFGTDDNLHNLHALFVNTCAGAPKFYQAKAWEHLLELATQLRIAQNALIEIIEGATDGRTTSSETPGGTRAGTNGASSARKEDAPGTATGSEHESQSALQQGTTKTQT